MAKRPGSRPLRVCNYNGSYQSSVLGVSPVEEEVVVTDMLESR